MPKRAAPKPGSVWQKAFRDHRLLLLVALLYVLGVCAEAVYCGVPFLQFLRVGFAVLIVLIKCIMLLLGLGVWIFVRELFREGKKKETFGTRIRRAHRVMSETASDYFDGEIFAYGCVGVLVLFAIDFFFIQKSLIRIVHPYDWDPALARFDKLVHFGHFPHEWVIPFSDALHLGHVYDVGYYLWFVMMYVVIGYALFVDTDLKRRLRLLWSFFLCWALLGSVAATLLASVGPLFYHEFYPTLPNPYSDLVEHFDKVGQGSFPIAWFSRDKLIEWTVRSKDLININALSAMPSLHVSIAWLAVLYARTGSRFWFAFAAAFCAMIMMGTVFFGFHFAVDGYFSIIAVSLFWWVSGRLLDRRFSGNPALKRA